SNCTEMNGARGPELIEISMTSNLVAVGKGFIDPVKVFIGESPFIDDVGFADAAKVRGGTRVIQRGKLTDGRTIAEAVPPGRLVRVRFLNRDGGETKVFFR